MTPSASQSVLKVCLFTDIVGSTDLKQRLGDARSAEMIGRHDALFREGLTRFGGREEVNPGDGFFATFEVPSEALRCALYFQEGLRELKTSERLTARVGIHMGEIIQMKEHADDARPKLLGLAVDTAARVMSLAQPEQVLLTRHAFDSVRQQVQSSPGGMPVEWRAHGPYSLKGLDEPIEVFEAGIDGVSPLSPPPTSDKAARTLAPGEEAVLGWRPAVGLHVPSREGWVLEGKLGEGGFGEVWLARHHKTREPRAFKFCFQADRLRTLKRELTLFRLLKEVLGERDDIARLYEVQLDEAPYYLEMEYTSGGSLSGWAEQQGGIAAVPMAQRLETVAQIADALAAAHSVGVIHKDVKPANVLIQPRRDGSTQARLTDFGIGQLLTTDLLKQAGITLTGFDGKDVAGMTDLGSRTGTRLYMAPELLAGRTPSMRSDIFALGVLLYQAAAGDLGKPLAQGWEHDVADELVREDIASAVAGDVDTRLPAADVLARRLRTLDQRRAQRAAERQRAVQDQRRRRLLTISMFAVPVLAALAIAAALLWEQRARLQQVEAAQTLQAFVTDVSDGLARYRRLSPAVRAIAFDMARAAVESSAYTERVTGARSLLYLSLIERRPDFWNGVESGAIWKYGEWLELAEVPRSQWLADVDNAALNGMAVEGSSRRRYASLCLQSSFGPLDPPIRDALLSLLPGETDPAVLAAGWRALRRSNTPFTPAGGASYRADPLSGLTLVRLPAVKDYRPGSPADEPDRYLDEDPPAKGVAIPPIWLAMTETTLSAFKPFVAQADLPDAIRRSIEKQLADVPADQHGEIAVHSIRPVDAQRFCEWLTQSAGKTGPPRRYRLPTEAEWEYACRAGHDTPYCYGLDPKYLRYFAVAEGREGEADFRVATKMPNAYGLFDMHGNVWEICDSPYRKRYDDADPQLDATGRPLAVQRGGANYSPAARCRSAQRNFLSVEAMSDRAGFRVVMEAADRGG